MPHDTWNDTNKPRWLSGLEAYDDTWLGSSLDCAMIMGWMLSCTLVVSKVSSFQPLISIACSWCAMPVACDGTVSRFMPEAAGASLQCISSTVHM